MQSSLICKTYGISARPARMCTTSNARYVNTSPSSFKHTGDGDTVTPRCLQISKSNDLKRTEVEDVLGGEESWKNKPKSTGKSVAWGSNILQAIAAYRQCRPVTSAMNLQ